MALMTKGIKAMGAKQFSEFGKKNNCTIHYTDIGAASGGQTSTLDQPHQSKLL